MNVASALLQSDWLVYCKAMNLPCVPPDKHSEITVAMMICVSIAIIIFISAVHHAITRLHIATPAEFQKANDRLSTGIPLLVSLEGKELRHLCRDISRDLIQVTGFAEKHLSECFHKYYPRHRSQIGLMLRLMKENRVLRTEAVILRFLCFLPIVFRPPVRRTNATTRSYLDGWLPMFERYKVEYPECQDPRPA